MKKHKISKRIVSITLVLMMLAVAVPITLSKVQAGYWDGCEVDGCDGVYDDHGYCTANDNHFMPMEIVYYGDYEEYQIINEGQLQEFAQKVNSGMSDITVRLCASFSVKMNPIEYFSGTFYGDDHYISLDCWVEDDVAIDDNTKTSPCGLFKKLENANIYDLNIYGTFRGREIGAVACSAVNSKIINCHSDSTYYVPEIAGGIVESASNCVIENCTSSGVALIEEGSSQTVMYMSGIANSVGNSTTVKNCSSSINYSVTEGTAGICGNLVSGSIINCHNNSNAESGIAKYIINYSSSSRIEQCYNTGTVKNGICEGIQIQSSGGSIIIKDCYNTCSSATNGAVNRISYGSNLTNVAVEITNFHTLSGNLFGSVKDKNSIVKINNCYYKSDSETDSFDGTSAKSESQFASGEVACLLNNSSTQGVWKQTLSSDAYPNFSGKTVSFFNGKYVNKNVINIAVTGDSEYCYTGKPIVPYSEITNDGKFTGEYKTEYGTKNSGSDTYTYSETPKTDVGTYSLKVSLEDSDNIGEVYKTYSITQKPLSFNLSAKDQTSYDDIPLNDIEIQNVSGLVDGHKVELTGVTDNHDGSFVATVAVKDASNNIVTNNYSINPDCLKGEYHKYSWKNQNYKCEFCEDIADSDTKAPVITCTRIDYIYSEFSVEDKNLDSVTLDGSLIELIDGKYRIAADDKMHKVIAYDKAGNSARANITVYTIDYIESPIKDLTEKNVKSSDKNTVEATLQLATLLLNNKELNTSEAETLQQLASRCNNFLNIIVDISYKIEWIHKTA